MSSLEAPLCVFSANAKVRSTAVIDKLADPYSNVTPNWSSLSSVRLFIDQEIYDAIFLYHTRTKQVDFTGFSRLTSLCLVFGATMNVEDVQRVLLFCRVSEQLRSFVIEWGQGLHIPYPLENLAHWRFDDRVAVVMKVDPEKLAAEHASHIPEECRALLQGLVWVVDGGSWVDLEKRRTDNAEVRLPRLRHRCQHVVVPRGYSWPGYAS
ncbi:hypothetical protein PQX77_003543 [Marasmius sp. AFHP31]|nr:hypothetical protein PQX77_003543 [Marasmius sp. AFHP31]